MLVNCLYADQERVGKENKNMSSQNTELLSYFNWLSELLNQTVIREERALSTTVEIPLLNLAGSRTLLQILGYDNGQSYPQYPVRGFGSVKTGYADFRVGGENHYWVLELKAPSEKVDNPDFAKQVQDYMEGVNEDQGGVPLGVLFNGYEARVFINPKYRPLKSYSNKSLVAVKKANNIDELGLLFQELQCNPSPPDTLKLARRYAQGHSREEAREQRDLARKEEVRKLVSCLLPCPEREVAAAIIEAIPRLSELNVKPEQLQEVWQSLVAENEAKHQKRRTKQKPNQERQENSL